MNKNNSQTHNTKNILLFTTAGVLAAASIAFIILFLDKKVDHIVTFESNGGTYVETIKVKDGATIPEPNNPTRPEYNFGGWYIKPDLTGSIYTFNEPIKSDVTLYAHWLAEEDKIPILLDANDGEIEGGGGSSYKKLVDKGSTFQEVVEEFNYLGATKDNEDFTHWTIKGNRVGGDYVFNDYTHLIAEYKPVKDGCLTCTARSDNTVITISSGLNVLYSTDGDNWTEATSGTNVDLPLAGDQLFIKREMETLIIARIATSNYPFAISGPIESLYNSEIDNLPNGAFTNCFSKGPADADNTHLVSASNLNLSNIVLKPNCYESMFSKQVNLISAPKLPAATLTDSCYKKMFYNCTSLVNAPELNATILTNNCYQSMFEGCSSLYVNENKFGTKIFTCPDMTDLTDPVTDMFKATSGSFIGTPTAGNTYNNY